MTSPYATTGNKPVTFRASYEENGITGECNFTAYIYVKDGYEDLSQMAPGRYHEELDPLESEEGR